MIMVSCLMACFMPGSWLDAYTLDILGEQNKDKIGQFQLWCVLRLDDVLFSFSYHPKQNKTPVR
jgi:hypothetical protein